MSESIPGTSDPSSSCHPGPEDDRAPGSALERTIKRELPPEPPFSRPGDDPTTPSHVASLLFEDYLRRGPQGRSESLTGDGPRALCMPYFGGASLSQVLRKLWEHSPSPTRGEELVRALEAVAAQAPEAPAGRLRQGTTAAGGQEVGDMAALPGQAPRDVLAR